MIPETTPIKNDGENENYLQYDVTFDFGSIEGDKEYDMSGKEVVVSVVPEGTGYYLKELARLMRKNPEGEVRTIVFPDQADREFIDHLLQILVDPDIYRKGSYLIVANVDIDIDDIVESVIAAHEEYSQ